MNQSQSLIISGVSLIAVASLSRPNWQKTG